MIRRCAWLIAAVFSISACGAEGQDALVSSDLDRTGSTGGQRQLVAAENPDPRQPTLGANPLSRIPMNSLSVSRERPLFPVSRRPPAPPPAPTPPAHIEAPPPTESGGPPFTLSGTAIGGSRDVAVIYDETKAASGAPAKRPGGEFSGARRRHKATRLGGPLQNSIVVTDVR
jgi:hypothetical protein